MKCQIIPTPTGVAIVCGTRGRTKRCACGKPAGLLCDWKGKGTKTCDAPICSACTTKPAPDKDLCPDHARAWADWQQRNPND